MSEKENPVCPNCGSIKISKKLVQKRNALVPKNIPLKEYLEKQQTPQPYGYSCGTIEMATYVQIVVQCEECGYTLIKNLNEVRKK